MTHQPDALDALIRGLFVERYATTDRDLPAPMAALETPEVFAHRQAVLCDALDGPDYGRTEGAVVIALDRRQRRKAA